MEFKTSLLFLHYSFFVSKTPTLSSTVSAEHITQAASHNQSLNYDKKRIMKK